MSKGWWLESRTRALHLVHLHLALLHPVCLHPALLHPARLHLTRFHLAHLHLVHLHLTHRHLRAAPTFTLVFPSSTSNVDLRLQDSLQVFICVSSNPPTGNMLTHIDCTSLTFLHCAQHLVFPFLTPTVVL